MHSFHKGVIKTHRLLLLIPTVLMAPQLPMPSPSYGSHLTIGPKALKDMIEHFPSAKGASGKTDPQLVWCFGDEEVRVRSWETSVDSKGVCCLFGSFIR